MDRTLQRSLVGSTVAHLGLLLFVLLVGGLAAKKVIEPDVPVLEIIPTDLRLTMGDQIGGGTPTPRPLANRDVAGPPPPAPTPAPTIQQPPPQPQQAVQPRVREESRPVEPVVKPAPVPPKTAPPKIEVAKEPRNVAKAQDVDPHKLADKPVKMASASPVQVSNDKRKRTDDDRREATEAVEAAAAAARARDQRMASVRNLANRLSGAATGVSKNAGSSTQIDMPGPGGEAYGPYLSYLQNRLQQWWKKPATSSEREIQVTVELTIARDGTVLSAELTRRSGVPALDRSVEDLFRQHRKLNPLPPEYRESRLVVPVKFVLESSLSP